MEQQVVTGEVLKVMVTRLYKPCNHNVGTLAFIYIFFLTFLWAFTFSNVDAFEGL
jgi:hypothetical protein